MSLVLSGVPEGGVIGPLLLVIFINDLPGEIINDSKLYADDTKILSIMNSDECVTNLQKDLDRAFKWTQDWLLKFNPNKCVVMHYGQNNRRSPLYIDGHQLAESEIEKDVGVMFSTNLKVEESSDNSHKQSKSNVGSNQKIFCSL